jgi:kinesin family member 2/24
MLDDSPFLEGDIPDDLTGAELKDLKIRHERLVDLILKEEDDLIAAHHRFIENTINSVKEQERIRHEVNLPGSDVEEYIINLDSLLTAKQADLIQMKDMISNFHSHIKQEQELSMKFYSMQEDQTDIAPDLDDY